MYMTVKLRFLEILYRGQSSKWNDIKIKLTVRWLMKITVMAVLLESDKFNCRNLEDPNITGNICGSLIFELNNSGTKLSRSKNNAFKLINWWYMSDVKFLKTHWRNKNGALAVGLLQKCASNIILEKKRGKNVEICRDETLKAFTLYFIFCNTITVQLHANL